MRRILFLLVGLTFLVGGASAQVSSLMLKTLIQVKSTFVDEKGGQHSVSGGGFIVNGTYLATCYHLYHPKWSAKRAKRMIVYYNFSVTDNKQLKSDSVEIDLAYKYTGKQYDFSKHIYKEDQLETDFIILKLKRIIPVKPLPMNTGSNLPKYTPLPMIAFDNQSNRLRNDTLIYVYPQFFAKKEAAYQLVVFGPAHPGFSGSPVFNLNGEIVGIMQLGMPEINETYLSDVAKAGWLTETDLVGIRRGYIALDPYNISFITNIKYFNDTYIKNFR